MKRVRTWARPVALALVLATGAVGLLTAGAATPRSGCAFTSVTTTSVSSRVQGNSTTQCDVGLKGTITQRVMHRYAGIIPDAEVFWGAKLGPQNGTAFSYSIRRCDNQTRADYYTTVSVDYGGSKTSAVKNIQTCAGTGG